MKKAGILTLFGEYNFGNRLQNYAVQEVLKKYGLDVETIKYRLKSSNGPAIVTQKDENRLAKFKEFNENITFANEVLFVDCDTPENFGEKYDYIAIGSDQIWNYSFSGFFSHKALGSFAPKYKKFSFAASFGVDYVPEKDTELYNICKKYLNDIKAISVREDVGEEIIRKITNREDVEVILDPTMMLTAKDWENIAKKPDKLKSDKFIVKSFLGNVSKEVWKEITRIAQENNCEIIDISDKESPFYDVGPAEFLYLEKNAFLVATDSFHSCVFSILFNTPFVIFERQDSNKSMYSRIETLLEKFEMKNRVFKGEITKEIIKGDFSKVQNILKKEREKANKFIEKALS